MRTEIWNALLLVFDFLAIAAIGYFLTMRFLRPPRNSLVFEIVPMYEGVGADVLYARHLQMLLLGQGNRGVVIALDTGLSPDSRRYIETFCRSTEGLFYSSPAELPALLSTITKERASHARQCRRKN